MSYMRYGYPLRFFRGESKSYVFSSSEKKGMIEDWGDKYKDDASFCELLGVFIKRATKDKAYADKLVSILAIKLGITEKLRDKPMTDEEFFDHVKKVLK